MATSEPPDPLSRQPNDFPAISRVASPPSLIPSPSHSQLPPLPIRQTHSPQISTLYPNPRNLGSTQSIQPPPQNQIPFSSTPNIRNPNPLGPSSSCSANPPPSNLGRTWSSLLKEKPKSAGTIPMFYLPSSSVDGVVEIDKSIEEEGIAYWEQTVVGFFLDKKYPYTVVQDFIKKNWKLLGEVEISLDSEIYYFRFTNADDRARILDEGAFVMNKKMFIIKPWSQEIEENRGIIKNVPIWVKLFNVPKHLWSAKGLSKITSSIGHPQCMDKITEERKSLSFARVLVDVNAEKELPQSIRIKFSNGKYATIPVEFTWKPHICTKCKVFGHTNENCIRVVPKKKPIALTEQRKEKNSEGVNLVKKTSTWRRKETNMTGKVAGEKSVAGEGNSNRFDVFIDDESDSEHEIGVVEADLNDTEPSMSLEKSSDVPPITTTNGDVIQPSLPLTTPNSGVVIQPPQPSNVPTTVSIPLEEGEIVDNGEMMVPYTESEEDYEPVFTDHLPSKTMCEFPNSCIENSELRRSIREKRPTEKGGEWTTVESKKKKKGTTSPGEIEPTLAMIKKLDSQTKNKKVKTLNGYIVEVWDDSKGVTFACRDCGAFFTSSVNTEKHIRKEHPLLVKQVFPFK